jgi:hypothetical protein
MAPVHVKPPLMAIAANVDACLRWLKREMLDLEVLPCKSGRCNRLRADPKKKRWNRTSLVQVRMIEIVLPAERDRAPSA